MFNLYITEVIVEKDPIRQSLIDTTRTFLKVTDRQLVNTYLTQAIKNYEMYSRKYEESLKLAGANNLDQTITTTNTGSKQVHFDFNKIPSSKDKKSASSDDFDLNLFAKYSSLDLIAVLAQYSDASNINLVYSLALSGIEVNIYYYFKS